MKLKWQSEIGVNEPVLCPECGQAMEFISVGQHGNVLTNEPMQFVAFYGCKPCFAAMVCKCDQQKAKPVWDEQIAAHKDDKFIHNPIDEFFDRADDRENGYTDDDPDDQAESDEPKHDPAELEFRTCIFCGKPDVLPNEWFDICPNCLFKRDFLGGK